MCHEKLSQSVVQIKFSICYQPATGYLLMNDMDSQLKPTCIPKFWFVQE